MAYLCIALPLEVLREVVFEDDRLVVFVKNADESDDRDRLGDDLCINDRRSFNHD